MKTAQHDDHVFINCPFDDAYRPLFEAVVFAVHDCGFIARCALEIDDSSQARIERIGRIIAECRLGIHDISRTEADPDSGLPRFNMPLELGLFLGAKMFGSGVQRRKNALILDRDHFRFQRYISDIAGQDISAHNGEPHLVAGMIRDWLRKISGKQIPGRAEIAARYERFRGEMPVMCRFARLDPAGLIFNDLAGLVGEWLDANPW